MSRPRPAKLMMISGSGWRSNACSVAVATAWVLAQATSNAPSSATAWRPIACSISGGWRRHGAAKTWRRRVVRAARRRWRPARSSSPTSWGGVSPTACAGVGGRPQLQAGAHLRPAHHRIRAAAVAAGGLTVGTHQHREAAAHLVERPGLDPQKEQRSATVPHARTGVRLNLRLLVPAVSRLSATIPRAASRRTTTPSPTSCLSRADVVPSKASEGLVKGCGWHGMQEVRPPRLRASEQDGWIGL
jgi:hypothetical protein